MWKKHLLDENNYKWIIMKIERKWKQESDKTSCGYTGVKVLIFVNSLQTSKVIGNIQSG